MSNESKFLEDLRAALLRLEGVQCWSVIAGEPTGPVILLALGEKVPLPRKLKNENLRADQRCYEGEFELLVDCVWRLDSHRNVICGAWDDNSLEGPMRMGLKQLEDDVIANVDLVEPGLDLIIQFHGDHTLRIFCDQVNEVDQRDNYALFTPKKVFTVGWKSSLRMRENESKLLRAKPPGQGLQ